MSSQRPGPETTSGPHSTVTGPIMGAIPPLRILARGVTGIAFLAGVAVGALLVLAGIGLVQWIRRPLPPPVAPVVEVPAVRPAPPDVPTTSQALLAKAEPLLRAGSPDGVSLLEVFLVRHPNDRDVRLRYALALASEKKYEDARGQCEQLLKQDPNDVGAQIGMAKINSWNNDLPGALKLYDAILAKHPANYDARVGKAFTLMWLRRDAEARKLFESAARQAPDDPDVAAALRTLGASKAP